MFVAVVCGFRIRVNVGFVVGRLLCGWQFVWCLVCEVCCYVFLFFLAASSSSRSLVVGLSVCRSFCLSVVRLCEKVIFRVSDGNLKLPKITYLPTYAIVVTVLTVLTVVTLVTTVVTVVTVVRVVTEVTKQIISQKKILF